MSLEAQGLSGSEWERLWFAGTLGSNAPLATHWVQGQHGPTSLGQTIPLPLGTYCRQPLAHKEPDLQPHLLSNHALTREAHFIQIL